MPEIAVAQNLREALHFLDINPLEFGRTDVDESVDPARYVERPAGNGGTSRRRPFSEMQRLKEHLLHGRTHGKVFLSGHTGCGKSTELARLMADPDIGARFIPIAFRFEEQEQQHLDTNQVFFRVAFELYRYGNEKALLDDSKRWSKLLKEIDGWLYGESGIQAKEGSVSVEYNLLVAKVKQELKLSDARRQSFRQFGETHPSLMQDLIAELARDIETNLSKKEDHRELLVVIDDLDKVRDPERVRELFDVNFAALLQPPVHILSTVPRSGLSLPNAGSLRDNLYHLRAVQVLKRSTETDPGKAFDKVNLGFFERVLDLRVRPGLFEQPAWELAVLYSGGVIRDFFHLLRESCLWALHEGLETIPVDLMEDVVAEERRKWSYAIFPATREILKGIRQSHQIQPEDTWCLNASYALEIHNGDIWYEVNPLLWRLL